jgi:hypothetical protein
MCNLMRGAFSSFVPVMFDELRCSVLNVMVHGILLNYVFRPAPLHDDLAKRRVPHEEPVVKVVPLATAGRASSAMRLAGRKQKVGSLAEYLFGDARGQLGRRADSAIIDDLHKKYVLPLMSMHDQFKARLVNVGQRAFTDIERLKLQGILVRFYLPTPCLGGWAHRITITVSEGGEQWSSKNAKRREAAAIGKEGFEPGK